MLYATLSRSVCKHQPRYCIRDMYTKVTEIQILYMEYGKQKGNKVVWSSLTID